jgi:hypothetical protein
MRSGLRKVIAAVLVGLAQPCAAQELGRLFFTPEQRDALDARRKARMPDKPTAAPVVASPTTRLDGYVQRSGGRSTVFINGEPVPEGAAEASRLDTRRGDGRIPVRVGEGGARFPLKPGEVLDRSSGEVRDVIGEGRVQVRPAQ